MTANERIGVAVHPPYYTQFVEYSLKESGQELFQELDTAAQTLHVLELSK